MNQEISKAFSALRSSDYEALSLGTCFAQTELFLPILNSTFKKGSVYSPSAISNIQKFQQPSCQGEILPPEWYEDQIKYAREQKHTPYKVCYFPPHKFQGYHNQTVCRGCFPYLLPSDKKH